MQPTTILLTLSLALFAYAAPQGTPIADGTPPIPTSQFGPGNPPQCMAVAKNIPTCGLGCIKAAQRSINCNPVDFTCGCSGTNPSLIRDNAMNCVIDACGIAQAIQVQEQAEQLCECVGFGNLGFSDGSE